MTRLGMTVIALAIVPAVLAAQTDSSRMRDTARARGRQQQTSSGAIGRSSRAQRLSRDQVAQLQTALQQANCDPGAIDSVMGSHTRRAMNCARQKDNVTGNNPNDLYRALNLDFASSDTASGANSSGRANGSRGTRRTRSGAMRGDSTRMRSAHRDSTRRPSTRRDTTRPRG
jgi:hypothetical protein